MMDIEALRGVCRCQSMTGDAERTLSIVQKVQRLLIAGGGTAPEANYDEASFWSAVGDGRFGVSATERLLRTAIGLTLCKTMGKTIEECRDMAKNGGIPETMIIDAVIEAIEAPLAPSVLAHAGVGSML